MKKLLSIMLLLMLVVGVFAFAACEKTKEDPTVEKLTIKFDSASGSAVEDMEIDADTALTLPTPTRDGHAFDGWFFDEDCETEATVEGIKEKIKEGTLTIYAKWKVTELIVHYDTKGGAAIADDKVTASTSYALPTASRSSYEFKGWYMDENYRTVATETKIKNKISERNLTIYARWAPILTVHFDPKGGVAVPDMEVTESSSVVLPTALRASHEFAGWYYEEGLTTAVDADSLKSKVSQGSITVYAKWEAILIVQFDSKGGSVCEDKEVTASMESLTLPNPTKNKNDFAGWYFEDTYNTPVTLDALKAKRQQLTLTVYAKWEAVMTVHYDSKGGSACQDDGVSALTTTYTPPTPTMSRYEFEGWYFEDTYNTPVTLDALKARVQEPELTVYAKWRDERTLTVHYTTNGGSACQDDVVGATGIADFVLPTTQYADHHFWGWFFDGTFQTPYTAQGLTERLSDGETTLFAKWGDLLSGDTVTIQGLQINRTVINPIFDWTNGHGDTSFRVILTTAAGAVVEEKVVTVPHFELSDNLAYNTTYVLSIEGVDTNCYRVIEFLTVDGTEAVDLRTATFGVCEPFKSHMVIQRGEDINIIGRATQGVLVAIDFYGSTHYATANEQGVFAFNFAAREADNTPDTITIRVLDTKKIVIEDVLIGDVFLVSGQSNVQRSLSECSVSGQDPDWKGDVQDAVQYDVRYFYQPEKTASTPSDTTGGSIWSKVDTSTNTYLGYSAVGFMVGAMLGKALSSDNVPVGILYAAKGNTNITSWMGASTSQHYNGMIYPLRFAAIKGVVWYQGCNNSGKGIEYKGHLQTLFANWRALFNNAALPFYVVQLPCYDGDSGNNFDFSYVRESQLLACEEDSDAYLIATCDGGDRTDIHPKQKRYLCERVVKSILSTLYGADDVLPQGPVYDSFELQGSNAVITVKYGEGLTATGEIVGFELAGEDGKYYNATATINGEGKIVVSSALVSEPVNIRYGFSKSPFLNIYNKDGFLMSPFRTDVYNHNIDLLNYNEGAVYTSNPGGATMQTEVVEVGGKVGLQVTKPADAVKAYGILELAKWGAIGYEEHLLKLRLIGSNSGAKLVFRIVEGSYETWATPELTDDFTEAQDFYIPISYLNVSNEVNGIIDFQSIMRVELVIKESNAAVTVTVMEAKFVDFTRTAPTAFAIKDAKNDGHEVTVKYKFADYATSYRVIVSADGENFTNPIFDSTTTQLKITFNSSLCEENVSYYVKVIATNELGDTVATNSGMLVADVNRVLVADFHFATDEEFNTYKAEKLAGINSNLTLSRDAEKGLKVNIRQSNGWMDFIVKMTEGLNSGYDAMKVYLDLTEYKGSNVKIQVQTNGGSYSYTYDLNFSSKKEGYFTIPLSSFVNTAQSLGAFDGRSITRIKFGLTDYVAGASDNLYIGSIEFINQ